MSQCWAYERLLCLNLTHAEEGYSRHIVAVLETTCSTAKRGVKPMNFCDASIIEKLRCSEKKYADKMASMHDKINRVKKASLDHEIFKAVHMLHEGYSL